MYKQIKSEQAGGKTVKHDGISTSMMGRGLVVSFTDGTFVYFRAIYDNDDEPMIDEGVMSEEDALCFGDWILAKTGVAGAEEIVEIREARAKALHDRQLEAERLKYEQLKKKFEGKDVQTS